MSPRNDRSPRQRLDVDARREAILEAAVAEYAKGSYSTVTVTQIAARANASAALVFHYFESKAGLYTAVVQRAIESLLAAQRMADEQLPSGSSARDHVRTALYVYLDHIAAHPRAWADPLAGGQEPDAATELRAVTRARYVELLRKRLEPTPSLRAEIALSGYFGFVDSAALAWVHRGHPDHERDELVTTALGALEGALGDWAG